MRSSSYFLANAASEYRCLVGIPKGVKLDSWTLACYTGRSGWREYDTVGPEIGYGENRAATRCRELSQNGMPWDYGRVQTADMNFLESHWRWNWGQSRSWCDDCGLTRTTRPGQGLRPSLRT
jgi:hypothetical protein